MPVKAKKVVVAAPSPWDIAFGTAFTLATKINVLPMVIYTEFTLQANVAMAAALSFVLGAITWAVLAVAHHVEVFAPHLDARLPGTCLLSQALPGCGRAQGFENVQARAGSRLRRGAG